MEEYRIVLESQLGPREGSLLLEERGNGVLVGSITLLGVENPVQGERKDKNFIRLSHHLQTGRQQVFRDSAKQQMHHALAWRESDRRERRLPKECRKMRKRQAPVL